MPYFLGLLDACTGGGFVVLFVAILEVVMVSWIYGVDKIFEHIEEMEIKIPTFMKCYWRVCWKYLTPGNPIHITKLYIHLNTSHQIRKKYKLQPLTGQLVSAPHWLRLFWFCAGSDIVTMAASCIFSDLTKKSIQINNKFACNIL